jgi:hypothetical protein
MIPMEFSRAEYSADHSALYRSSGGREKPLRGECIATGIVGFARFCIVSPIDTTCICPPPHFIIWSIDLFGGKQNSCEHQETKRQCLKNKMLLFLLDKKANKLAKIR